MNIHGIGSQPVRHTGTPGAWENDAPEGESRRDAARAPRGDKVELSVEGRALAARASEEAALGTGSGRLDVVRERVRAGAYNDLAMAEEVARRMIASGDL